MRTTILIAVLLIFGAGCTQVGSPLDLVKGDCRISASMHGDGDIQDAYDAYLEAEGLLIESGLRVPNICDVHTDFVAHPDFGTLREEACTTSDHAAACVEGSRWEAYYVVNYNAQYPQYLTHEWLHILLTELYVKWERHHDIMEKHGIGAAAEAHDFR